MNGGGEMGRRVRETDWSQTPLGDYQTWPQSLRLSLSLVLNVKGIAALYWDLISGSSITMLMVRPLVTGIHGPSVVQCPKC